ncbi:membrane protein required for colicin V production [Gulbenkiania mobilis]|nr:membrane protein required for colicin V production [Gulbenkiania mobilis]
MVIGITVGSVIVALVRGLVAEVLALVSWLIAFWCAKEFAPALAGFLPADLPSEGLRLVAAFVCVFFLTWLATALLRIAATTVVHTAGLGGLNRMLGAVFGLARGLVLVTILVLVGGLSELPREPMWRNAVFAPPFETAALALRPWLPAMLADNIHYTG